MIDLFETILDTWLTLDRYGFLLYTTCGFSHLFTCNLFWFRLTDVAGMLDAKIWAIMYYRTKPQSGMLICVPSTFQKAFNRIAAASQN